MAMSSEEIARYITTALPDATVEFLDLAGDDNHWQVTVTSQAFAGKSRVVQHKMVYDALEGHVGGTLHALSVKTLVDTQ